MTVITFKRSNFKRILGGLLISLIVLWLVCTILRDVQMFNCCRAWQFYIQPEHDAGPYAYCLELDDVMSGDGKDCFVWYIFKYLIFGPLYFAPIPLIFSLSFLKGTVRKIVAVLSVLAMVPSLTILFVFLVN